MLGIISGPKVEEVTGDWRKLHNEKLYFPLHIIRVIKWRTIWAGHVARIRDEKYETRLGNAKERNHLEDLDVDG